MILKVQPTELLRASSVGGKERLTVDGDCQDILQERSP